TPSSTSQMVISWKDNSTVEAGYRLERRLTNPDGSVTAWTTINLAANTTSYTDRSLRAGTVYSYRITAVRSGVGDSAPSDVVSAATFGIGTGLTGKYYDYSVADTTVAPAADAVFKDANLKLTRVDSTLNFNWGSGSPARS